MCVCVCVYVYENVYDRIENDPSKNYSILFLLLLNNAALNWNFPLHSVSIFFHLFNTHLSKFFFLSKKQSILKIPVLLFTLAITLLLFILIYFCYLFIHFFTWNRKKTKSPNPVLDFFLKYQNVSKSEF